MGEDSQYQVQLFHHLFNLLRLYFFNLAFIAKMILLLGAGRGFSRTVCMILLVICLHFRCFVPL